MDNKEYILPSLDLLLKTDEVFESKGRYYSLSKLTYKKDLDKKLLVPLGIAEDKEKYFMDFNNISAILIGGETGSGKSVFLDSLIISLLLKNTPQDLNFLFIDPKQVELGGYNGIPHLIENTIIDDKKGIEAIKSINKLIDSRRELFADSLCKNINEYNDKNENKIPHIMIIIDEAVDILKIMDDSDFKYIFYKGVETGIHLIMATNSVVKEFIDKNIIDSFPYVLTFDLASTEQANYMNLKGSEFLRVTGEAYVKSEKREISKIQTPYISDKEIEDVVNFIIQNN